MREGESRKEPRGVFDLLTLSRGTREFAHAKAREGEKDSACERLTAHYVISTGNSAARANFAIEL